MAALASVRTTPSRRAPTPRSALVVLRIVGMYNDRPVELPDRHFDLESCNRRWEFVNHEVVVLGDVLRKAPE